MVASSCTVNVVDRPTDIQGVSTARLIALSILLLSAAVRALPCDSEERGTAGWYGARFAGYATASGEPFDPDALTAAHHTLPLGSVVEVTDTGSRNSVQVTINDRGPYAQGRIIELSRAAADALEMIEDGSAEVHICVLSAPAGAAVAVNRGSAASVPSSPSGFHSGDTAAIQVASFSNPENVERAAARLAAEGLKPEVLRQDGLHRLVVVDVPPEETRKLIEQLDALGFPGAFRLGGMPTPGR